MRFCRQNTTVINEHSFEKTFFGIRNIFFWTNPDFSDIFIINTVTLSLADTVAFFIPFYLGCTILLPEIYAISIQILLPIISLGINKPCTSNSHLRRLRSKHCQEISPDQMSEFSKYENPLHLLVGIIPNPYFLKYKYAVSIDKDNHFGKE